MHYEYMYYELIILKSSKIDQKLIIIDIFWLARWNISYPIFFFKSWGHWMVSMVWKDNDGINGIELHFSSEEKVFLAWFINQ